MLSQTDRVDAVPTFELSGDGGGAGQAAAIERLLHDHVAQALFRADLALSDLTEVLPGSAPERRLVEEALESVLAALRDVTRIVGELREQVPADGR